MGQRLGVECDRQVINIMIVPLNNIMFTMTMIIMRITVMITVNNNSDDHDNSNNNNNITTNTNSNSTNNKKKQRQYQRKQNHHRGHHLVNSKSVLDSQNSIAYQQHTDHSHLPLTHGCQFEKFHYHTELGPRSHQDSNDRGSIDLPSVFLGMQVLMPQT